MITDLFIEQFYWLVLSLLRLDLSSDFDLDCVRSVGRFIDVITFDFCLVWILFGLIILWCVWACSRAFVRSRVSWCDHLGDGRLFLYLLYVFLISPFFFFFPFPCNTGSTRESSGPSAGKSYHSCAIEHQIQQILRHLETTGIQNTSHCICQLKTKMCTWIVKS